MPRVQIPKADSATEVRPLGSPSFEDVVLAAPYDPKWPSSRSNR